MIRALILSGGGFVGISWQSGLATGLLARGVDLRRADLILGTSGGSVAGSQLALVHIGDSRAYLLRDAELFQITHDDTVVQAMVDEGRLTREEAASHPQRAMLLRALDGRPATVPAMRLHQPRPGDRYLLCSDGVSAVIPDNDIQRVLSVAADPENAAAELMALVHGAGAPDNVTVLIVEAYAYDRSR